ncbi:hypothetical protein ACIQVT_00360 [Streptomyces sp. NPDC100445]|uniref:hypothetical protein n=1 Tax=Streptomyces sp. NPDC100445 TaxID=3366102 RepID=UPI00382D6E5D
MDPRHLGRPAVHASRLGTHLQGGRAHRPREEHEAELALALDAFLRRAAGKERLSTVERRVMAKSRASETVSVPAGEINVLDVLAPSFGLAGVYAAPDPDDETLPDEDGDGDGEVVGDGPGTGDISGGSLILSDQDLEEDQWLP